MSDEVKRYWLFGGDKYYPGGGLADFVQSFDDSNDAIKMGRAKYGASLEWFHVLDAEAFTVVFAEGDGCNLGFAGGELQRQKTE